MPKEISGYNFSPYDWDLLLDGRIWRCEQGIDFGRQGIDVRCRPRNFVAKVRAEARKRDLLSDIKVDHADGSVVLRARRKPSQEPARPGRPRLYESNAERQRAYRDRKAGEIEHVGQ